MSPQMNLRITKELADSLDLIAKHYSVDRSDWVKIKLAEVVEETRREIERKEWFGKP